MKIKSKLFLGALSAVILLPGTAAQASTYHADSDTGIEALDYLEARHRAARTDVLTSEQKQLVSDAETMKNHLRRPLDPQKPMPVAFEGDDLTYDERTGDFIAKGKVKVLQLDAHRFESEDVSGNLQKQEIHIPGKAHMLQMTPNQPKIILDGYETNYNYGTKTGTMSEASGKVDDRYITGKRFEFYPDRIVVHHGTETHCSAKRPDYKLSADKLTYYPETKKVVLDKVRFWIKNTLIMTRDHYETTAGDGRETRELPRVGYNSDDGVWVRQYMTYPINNHFKGHFNLDLSARQHWRSNYDVKYYNRNMETGIVYGHFEDSDNNWIKREPSFVWSYGRHFGHSPLAYNFGFEFGRWYGNGVHSNHSNYSFQLMHDPIEFGKNVLHLATGYEITRESYDKSRIDGVTADAVLTHDYDDRWSSYVGYHYNKRTKENSVFDFDTEDYRQRLESGFSYRVDDNNRLALGTRYGWDRKEWDNIDYYWFHDMHCAQSILRYKSLGNTWHVRVQFTPW